MKKILQWQVLRLVWESRGLKMEAVALDLQKRFPGRDGLSVSSIQRMTKTDEEAEDDVAAFIRQELPILPNHQTTAEIVRMGLALMEQGHPVDLEALAARVAARLPKGDELAEQVAAKVPRPASADEVARAVADRLPSADEGKLSAAIAARLLAELEPYLFGAAGVVLLAIIILVIQSVERVGSNPAPVPAASPTVTVAPQPGPVIVVMNGEGVAEILRELWLPPVLGGDMGTSKKHGPPMPRSPLPGQWVPPCPEASEAIFGGCWRKTAGVAPCPPGEAEYEGGCYIAIQAPPKQPLGGGGR